MRSAAIYHLYVRSFQDSTGSGTGDLRGVLQRLPHIVSLGADAIWLSPFYVSPMDDLGYDIADHCDVDPLFGTLEDFDALVSAAHGAGLKVMIDLVFSHTSDRHPWFEESSADRTNPKADWYVWADPKPDGTPPNNWLGAFGGSAWTWNRQRQQYYLHDFLPSQPSLDFANLELRKALLDIAEFWVERGVDAFRIDTMNSYFHDRDLRDNPPAPIEDSQRPRANPFAQQLHLYDRAQRGDIAPLESFVAAIELLGATTVVGEIGNRLKAGKDQSLARCYTYCLPKALLNADEMGARLAEAIDQSPDGRIMWALSNHDHTRHVTRFGAHGEEVEAVARLTAALLASLPGAIGIYQGEELGFEEGEVPHDELRDPFGIRFWPELKGRDGCRTPMAWDSDEKNGGFSGGDCWLPVQASHLKRCVAGQIDEPSSLLAFYRDALAFRKTLVEAGEGGLASQAVADTVLAFTRAFDGFSLIAIFNMSREMAVYSTQDLPATFEPGDVLYGSTMPVDGRFILPPFGYFVAKSPR
ncbi:MAG: alpha-amylase family glycosyl hydrolase [Rhizobiaceae bacterium]